MGPTCRSISCTFCAVTLRVLNHFECSWVYCKVGITGFTTHPRTFKTIQYSQSYKTTRATVARRGRHNHPHQTEELCKLIYETPCRALTATWADSRNSLGDSVDVVLKRDPRYTFSKKHSRIAFAQISLFLELNYITVRSFIF